MTLAPFGVACILLGLWHLFGRALAKSILEGLALLRARVHKLGGRGAVVLARFVLVLWSMGIAFTRTKASLAGEGRSEVQGVREVQDMQC